MTKFILVFALLTQVLITYSQDLDSLKTILDSSKGYRYANTSKTIATSYLRQNRYDSAEKYYAIAITVSKRIGEHKLTGKCLNNQGVSNYMRGRFKEAVILYQEALEEYRLLKNDTLLSQSLTNLGLTFKGLGIYDKALDYLYESATILERLNLKKELSANWDGIGNIHRELNNYNLSIEYLNLSLKLRVEISYILGVAQSYHNLGIWYIEQEDLINALSYFKKSLTLKKELNNKKTLSNTLSKLGEVYYELDSLNLSKRFFLDALKSRTRSHDEIGILNSSNHLAKLAIKTEKWSEANHWINNAEDYCSKSVSLSDLAKTYELKKEYLTYKNEYKEALNYANKLHIIRQRIIDEERTKSLIESEIRYDVGRKELEILNNQIQLSFLKKRNIWQGVIVIILIILIIVLIRFYYISRKLSNEREKGKRKVEQLLKELHHRTKNNLQAQSMLIKLQSKHLSNHTAKNAILEVSNRMKAVTLIHQSLLYNSSELDISEKIDLSEYLKKLTENLMIAFKYNRNKINLIFDLNTVEVDINLSVPIGLFVNEAITNVFKHAYSKQPTPTLKVCLTSEVNSIFIKIQDNGIGFTQSNYSNAKSFGIITMNDLATQLNGMINIKNNNGMEVELIIPKKLKGH